LLYNNQSIKDNTEDFAIRLVGKKINFNPPLGQKCRVDIKPNYDYQDTGFLVDLHYGI